MFSYLSKPPSTTAQKAYNLVQEYYINRKENISKTINKIQENILKDIERYSFNRGETERHIEIKEDSIYPYSYYYCDDNNCPLTIDEMIRVADAIESFLTSPTHGFKVERTLKKDEYDKIKWIHIKISWDR